MIPVSAEWQKAIKEQFRYPGYLRVTIQVTPPGLHESLLVSSPSTDSVSSVDKMHDDNPTLPTPYATLERGRWVLNGKYKILPSDAVTDDWWSTPMKSGSKEITFTFDTTYTIPGLYVEWDVVNNSYPTQLTLEGYDVAGDKKYTYEVTNVSSATGFVEVPMDNVKKVVMTINAWSQPTWRARINEILFGLYAKYDSINNGRIMSATSIDYSHPLSKELPKHTLEVSLRNLDNEFDPSLQQGVAKYLANRQLIKCQWGFTTSYGNVEWTPSLDYFVQEFQIPEAQRNVTIKSGSRLELLTKTIPSVTYDATERTFYDIAQNILEQSDILRTSDTEIPWVLSEKLKQFHTNAPMPESASNAMLQLLAGAAGLNLYLHPVTGFIHIDEFSPATPQEIGMQQSLDDPKVEIQNTLRTVSIGVTTYNKKTKDDKVEVGKSTMNFKGNQTVDVKYNCDFAVDVECAISGATKKSFTAYSNHAVVEFDTGNTAQEIEVTITLTGYVVEKTQTFTQTYNDPNVQVGLDIKLENPFITNTEKLQELTDKIVAWYSKPQQLQVPYLGYPELTAGDPVNLTTVYGNLTVQVVRNTLNFNGGFSGKVDVR